MHNKKKEEKPQVAHGQGNETKKKGIMISHTGVKKVILAQKYFLIAYPSRSSPSFQSPPT